MRITRHQLWGRISDLLKFLVSKVGENFVLDHNVKSQEVAQAKPRPELAGALETILELAGIVTPLHRIRSERHAQPQLGNQDDHGD
jgi:hypothetical protein